MNRINDKCFLFLFSNKTNQLDETVLMIQIESVVRKVNMKKVLEIIPDPIVKPTRQNCAK